MTKLEQIKSSIGGLSASEIANLREWLEELDASVFDEKIERDAKAGKLDKLIAEARANYKAGQREEFRADGCDAAFRGRRRSCESNPRSGGLA